MKKRKLRHKTAYTQRHVFCLCCGCDFFGDTFGKDELSLLAGLQAAWKIPELQRAAFIFQERRRPGTLPMGFYLFDERCPRRYRRKYLGNRPANELRIAQELRATGIVPALSETETKQKLFTEN